MLAIIDIPYMVCCHVYKRKGRDKEDIRMGGTILLSGIYLFNLMFLALFISENYTFFEFDDYYEDRVWVVICLLLLLSFLLYIRFYRITNYDKILTQFQGLNDTKQKIYYLISVFYLITSFILLLTYVVMTGGK